jgi:hypothetical protein
MADPDIVPDEFLFAPELVTRESVAGPPPALRRRSRR